MTYRPRALPWLVLCLLYSIPWAHALEQDAPSRRLVQDIVQAYGGASAIERITGLNAQGSITTTMRQSSGSYKRWFQRPRMLRVETAYATSAETRILHGNQSWRTGPNQTMHAMQGVGHLATVYQCKQLDLPYGLLQGGYNLRYLGKQTLQGQETESMEVWDDEGPTIRLHADATTHYIVKVTGLFSANGASTSLTAEFSDFRLVDGYPLPFRISNFSGEAPLSQTVIQRYAVNPARQDDLFEPAAQNHDSAGLVPKDLRAAQVALHP